MSAAAAKREAFNVPSNLSPVAESRTPNIGPAEVIPFPSARRTWFVTNAFRDSARYSDSLQFLRSVVDDHQDSLAKLGVAQDLIDADVKSLTEIFFG
jgi:hypothetical protein